MKYDSFSLSIFHELFFGLPMPGFVEDLDGLLGEQLAHLGEIPQRLVEIVFAEDEEIRVSGRPDVRGPSIPASNGQKRNLPEDAAFAQ